MELRQELQITQAEPDYDGTPSWTLHDPIANHFFKLGQKELEILSLIGKCPHQEIPDRLKEKGVNDATVADVETFIFFLQKNDLLQTTDDAQREQLLAKATTKPHILNRFLKTYLSIKIPLTRPDKFLSRTIKYVEWAFSTSFRNTVFLLGIIGTLLVLQHWDAFFNTLPRYFNFEGMIAYGITMMLLKVIHELGHAYSAKYYGCKVPTMGIAILIFYPVLYTDTTDAWKLPRRTRIRIGLAGMATELSIAAICLFLWALLPDGILRSLCFFLSTTSLAMTLFVNLNPLMRFDGYYVFSDMLHIDNLQSRSTQLLMWKLRSFFTQSQEQPPERPDRWLLIYALSASLYRFSLTLVIALGIYHFFFKSLGILLLVAHITTFVIIPFGKGLLFLWSKRHELRKDRTSHYYLAALVCLLLFFFVPWDASVIMPATLHAKHEATIYAPSSGQISKLHVQEGQIVESGSPILTISSEEQNTEIKQLNIKLESLKWESSYIQFGDDYHTRLQTIQSDLEATRHRLEKLLEQRSQNNVIAGFSGKIMDMAPALTIGTWAGKEQKLLRVVGLHHYSVIAFASEHDIERVDEGMTGYFYPRHGGGKPVAVTITSIANANEHALSDRNHASIYGGDIPVRTNDENALIPQETITQITLDAQMPDKATLFRQQIGHIRISGKRESIAGSITRHIIGVLQRESDI